MIYYVEHDLAYRKACEMKTPMYHLCMFVMSSYS